MNLNSLDVLPVILFLLCVVVLAVLLAVAVLLLLRLAARPRWCLVDQAPVVEAALPDAGIRCGHCGAALVMPPARELAAGANSLLVFACRQCGKETCFRAEDLE